ncbi:hypothetical protein F5J12DRAFT_330189 [Pisolithus orientalis]|uniref:uncharacterized protein n=1 Tax=Pisolithus orientalis TaxID=936130 RepID=UPI002224156F|nr:uncharacterized protein F5J12DRAFT_330189 [Pisolithus orientalis]KAI5997839.1 hypothetical protein F5J12DRAFT_330189 [Pisolithus orientalis]
MRVVSLVIAAFVVASGAQNIGPGPYSVDAIQALYGASVASQCATTCSALANKGGPSGCQASVCCASNFIHSYRNCLECISEVLNGSSTTSSTKSAVDQLLMSCIQVGALPPHPTAFQNHMNHTSYAMASQTGSQFSLTNSPATGTGVVTVLPASSVIIPTSLFSRSPTITTSVNVTPLSTNGAVRTTVGQAHSGIASVLAWVILQTM